MDIQSIFSDASYGSLLAAFLAFSASAIMKSYFGAFGKQLAESTAGRLPLLMKILKAKPFEIFSFGFLGVLLALVITERNNSSDNDKSLRDLSSRVVALESLNNTLRQRPTIIHQSRIYACEAFPINLLQHTDEENFDKIIVSTGRISIDSVQGQGSQRLGNNAVRYFRISEQLQASTGQLLLRLEVGVSDETNSADGHSFGCNDWGGSDEERRRNWVDIIMYGVAKL